MNTHKLKELLQNTLFTNLHHCQPEYAENYKAFLKMIADYGMVHNALTGSAYLTKTIQSAEEYDVDHLFRITVRIMVKTDANRKPVIGANGMPEIEFFPLVDHWDAVVDVDQEDRPYLSEKHVASYHVNAQLNCPLEAFAEALQYFLLRSNQESWG
jgi:hypothetical protein